MAGDKTSHISQRELLEEFDPFNTRRRKKSLPYNDRIPGEQGRPGYQLKTLTWKFTTGVGKALLPQMTNKLAQFVRTRHRINYDFAYQIKNLETKEIEKYNKNYSSPWFSKLSEAKDWLQPQEDFRLAGRKPDRPNSKWAFVRPLFVTLKAVLDRQPFQIGLGFFLPD